ncbi:MAG: PEP-CTERM sorting domain-containing protein [Oscillatoria sp. SIO1A7]|nr:PEP-CTERM sorting domain-containing protein [Oscillatoria sp. SIO1A7]
MKIDDFRPEKGYGSTRVVGVMTALNKVLPLGAVAIALTLAPAAWAARFTDTIVVIDESGSMSGEHDWIRGMINDLDVALQAAGVTNNQYGLVGYGGLSDNLLGYSYNVGSGSSLFGSASDFASATNQLTASGGFEDGYQALNHALNEYTFREGAAVNLILVTDEDRDIHPDFNHLTYQTILDEFQEENNALLNAVLSYNFADGSGNQALGVDHQGNAYRADGTGGFIKTAGGVAVSEANPRDNSTNKTDYVDLAWATNGAAWDLNLLRAGGDTATSFTNAFVDVKVKEITTHPGGPTAVPEPGTVLGLVGMGAFGVASALKRKHKREIASPSD